jgi:hypothetical protein
MDFLLDEIAALSTGTWYPLSTFVSASKSTLFSANQPFRWIHFDEDSVWRIIHQDLEELGMVLTAKDNYGTRFFSPTPLGAFCLEGISEGEFVEAMNLRDKKFMVHPNFEVTMISKELNPRVLLELSMFATPIKLDTMSVFKISRESVSEGVGRGITREEMLEFISQHSKGEIPQNVEYSILDWGD